MEIYITIWRYSVRISQNEAHYGIVLADTIELAMEKVKQKYGNASIRIWRMIDDDYFDRENPDVWECYGYKG